MAKLNINYAILVVLSLLIATQINLSNATEEGDEIEVDNICLKNQKLTKIHFYIQDALGGPNATVFEVARAAVSTGALLSFGKILVLDDPITAGPGRDSERLGKAQGMVTSADMKTTAIAENINFVFTSGEYNGSAVSILGRNPLADRQRRLAVVGGTGVFRFTRGYAITSTYSSRVTEDLFDAVLEYTVYTTFCPMM